MSDRPIGAPRRVELLAPARDAEAARAAVDFGADAIYMGGPKFGARQAAGNSPDAVAAAAAYARRYGVRVYVTLNTLLWDDELPEAERIAREMIAAGADALIVQDMAYRRMNLPIELHASTQMCNRSPEWARFLGRAGFARVILERALTLDEIRAVAGATGAEVECFVHGAVCVGYSGRCFLSRSISDRSGNRGACSQPCRLPWDLQTAEGRTLLRGRHLLSVRDLCLADRIGDLLDAGVTSFKIEGRLKDTGYIRNVVACYRRAVDEALAARPGAVRASSGESRPDFEPDPRKSFTRGGTHYFLDGKRPGVASFDTPKSIGEYMGRVVWAEGGAFRLDHEVPLASGDGICFVAGGRLRGTHVNGADGGRILPDKADGIAPGVEVFRNFDRRFSKAVAASRTRRVVAVEARIETSAEGVAMRLRDADGVEAAASRAVVLARADDPAANAAAIRRQAMRSGDTMFDVTEIAVEGAERFVPASTVAALRREGLARLEEARLRRPLPHRIAAEDGAARAPFASIEADGNVTNRLAAAFYRDHGVETIEAPLERAQSLEGCTVMRSAYCLRRELGECQRERSRLEGPLYLCRGTLRYRLEFDCGRCEMSLRKER